MKSRLPAVTVFEIKVKIDFASGHFINGYPGDCARPHGHNWVMEVFVLSPELDHLGMAVDFRELKKVSQEITAKWDHRDLNETEDFKAINPTAENIAKLAFDRLSARFNKGGIRISKVTIWENERCCASYFNENGKTG